MNAPILFQQLNNNTDFKSNTINHIQILDEFHRTRGSDIEVIDKFTQWIDGLLPVHRCSQEVFAEIIMEGCLRSNRQLTEFHSMDENQLKEFHSTNGAAVAAFLTRYNVRWKKDIENVINYLKSQLQLPNVSIIETKKSSLFVANLGPKALNEIKDIAENIKKVVAYQLANACKAKCGRDKILGTDKNVFGILGPNTGEYGDFGIVLSRHVMNHPDSFITVNSATSLHSKNCYYYRPYCLLHLQDKYPDITDLCYELADNYNKSIEIPLTDEDVLDILERTKVGTCYHRWIELLAKDFQTQCMLYFSDDRELEGWNKNLVEVRKKVQSSGLEFEDLLKIYGSINSHGCFEFHGPSSISVQHIQRIFLPNTSKVINEIIPLLSTIPYGTYTNEGPSRTLADIVEYYDPKTDSINELQFRYFKRRMHLDLPIFGMSFSLEKCLQKELYLPIRFSTPGQGVVQFSIVGQHFRITLSPRPINTYDNKEIIPYTLVIGCNRNKSTYLKKGNIPKTRALVNLDYDSSPQAFPSNDNSPTTFWFKIDNGRLQAGRGGIGEGIFLDLVDESPARNIQYIGVSNFESKVDVLNLRIMEIHSRPKISSFRRISI